MANKKNRNKYFAINVLGSH